MRPPSRIPASTLTAAVCLIGLLAFLPDTHGQTPETLTGPGTFTRGTDSLTATLILAGDQDQSQVTVNPSTGTLTVEVLAGTATVTLGGTTAELSQTAVVELAQDPDTGAVTLTVVSGPPVTVTAGGVTTVVAAGTSTSLVAEGLMAPPAMAAEPAPPPLVSPLAVPSPVIGREVPLSPAR